MKKRAPRSIREIKRYVRRRMKTSDVRIDPQLNKFLWSRGIKNPPPKIRLLLSRKPCEEEEKQGRYYTHVSYVLVPSFAKLRPQRVNI